MHMRLTSVGKRYGRRHWALSGVDLTIAPGQVLSIIGSNGSGKSTLLAIMAGVTRPTTGTISGRSHSIGYVPELFPTRNRMTPEVYLRHMGRIRGLSPATAKTRAEILMDRLDLTRGLDTPLGELSKGNAQRVGLIQALLIRPDLLVLDEPESGLDEVGHGTLSDLIDEVAGDGGAVVIGGPSDAWLSTAAARYQLDAGHLSAAELSAAELSARTGPTTPLEPTTVRILLRRTEATRPLPADWATHCITQPGGTGLSATIAADGSDNFLRDALRCGWSVVSVLPSGSPAAPDGPPGRDGPR